MDVSPCTYAGGSKEVPGEEAFCLDHFSDYCGVPVEELDRRIRYERNQVDLQPEGWNKNECDVKPECGSTRTKFYPLGALLEADMDVAV